MTLLPKILIVGLGGHAVDAHLKHLVRMEIHPEIGVYDLTEDALDVPGRDGRTPRMMAAENSKKLTFMGRGREPQEWSHAEAFDVALEWADAVMICTPDRLHIPQMLAAVSAGRHVFCEKPLAALPEQMDTLNDVFAIAKAKGLTVTSCHPRRFDPPYKNLRAQLPGLVAKFGKLLEVKLDFTYHKPSKLGLHGGSMLQDHANHEIDYLMWLAGPSSFTAHKLWDEEDRYAMSGVREDGIVFNFGGTRRLNASVYPETIWLRLERAEVFVDTKDASNSYILDHETRLQIGFEAVGVTDYEVRFGDMNAHWLRLIAGEEENYLTHQAMLVNTEMSVGFQKRKTLKILQT